MSGFGEDMSEAELLKEVLKLCEKYRLYHFHSGDSRRDLGTRGFPDLVIVGRQLLFAELKTNYGKTSTHQNSWRWKIQLAGVKWVKWTPYDLEDKTIETVLASLA